MPVSSAPALNVKIRNFGLGGKGEGQVDLTLNVDIQVGCWSTNQVKPLKDSNSEFKNCASKDRLLQRLKKKAYTYPHTFSRKTCLHGTRQRFCSGGPILFPIFKPFKDKARQIMGCSQVNWIPRNSQLRSQFSLAVEQSTTFSGDTPLSLEGQTPPSSCWHLEAS